jgi:hypothetical protein
MKMGFDRPQKTTPTLARIAPGTVYRHPRGTVIYMKLASQENNQRFNCVDLANGFVLHLSNQRCDSYTLCTGGGMRISDQTNILVSKTKLQLKPVIYLYLKNPDQAQQMELTEKSRDRLIKALESTR